MERVKICVNRVGGTPKRTPNSTQGIPLDTKVDISIWFRASGSQKRAIVAQPQAGTVEKKTTFTEILSADDKNGKKKDKKPKLFEYLENLDPDEWPSHSLYVYRSTDGGANWDPIDKYLGMVCDEFQIKERIGGGLLRFLLKKDRVPIYRHVVTWEGPPKNPDSPTGVTAAPNGHATTLNPTMLGEIRAIMMDLMREMRGGVGSEEANRAALNLQSDVMKSTVPVLVETIRGVAVPQQQIVQSPEARMKETLELMTLMKSVFSTGPVNSVEETLKTITALKGAGLLGGGEKTSVGTELLRQLPNALHYLSTAVATWADAQKHTVDAQLAMQNKALPPAPPIHVPPPPAAATAENPAAPEKPVRNPIIDMIEGTILKIVLDMHAENQPLGDIVDEVIQTLDNYPMPELVQQIAKEGKQGLLRQFGESPILKNLPPEPWRTQFVELFLKKAAEMRAGPKPN